MVLAARDPESMPTPKSKNSPVLLSRVTPARVGLPKLRGKHPDNVDEEDEVELVGEGRLCWRLCPSSVAQDFWTHGHATGSTLSLHL